MMTSLPIHLSNHSPQALERNLSGRCNHQRRNEKAEAKSDEEIEGSVRKEVKDFFEKAKERRKQEELEAKKMKVVRTDSRLSYTIRKQKGEGNRR
jgi:FKBP-type peptidyl-prolyl cis-trans isomerase